jgi:hypothetical protein
MQIWPSSVFLAFIFGAVHAQQPSPWQGEWGAFSGRDAQEGRRLSIHDCHGDTCKFSIEGRSRSDHSGTDSVQSLILESPTEAKSILPGETNNAICTLLFERQTAPKPSIAVQATGDTCVSYYSTSSTVTMSGSYPLRSLANYTGIHAEECFLDGSAARMATCRVPAVSALEQQWQALAYDFPLQPLTSKHESTYDHAKQMDSAILNSCDADTDATRCLTARYTGEIAGMQTKKDAYLDGTVRPGDPAEGKKLAARIAGQYRHRFPNGDVQGDTYTSTDTLTIRPVGRATIHFDAELNFYNGHTCSLSGGALYRKDGSFVFDDSPANTLPDIPACRLAIVPTSKGVKFKDITGGCKNYCGNRGSWNGEGFTFSERVAIPVNPARDRTTP